MAKLTDVIERLAKVEVLLGNHLRHHERLAVYLLLPILCGIVLLLTDRLLVNFHIW